MRERENEEGRKRTEMTAKPFDRQKYDDKAK